MFGERFISHGLWPPCTWDITPCDLFLWRHLKYEIYQTNPHTHARVHTHTQEQPKDSILLEVSHISRKLQRVSHNVLIYPRQHGTSWESPVMWVRELHCTMLLQSHYCCNQSTTKGGNQCIVQVHQNASAWQSKTLCLCSVRNLLSFGFLNWQRDFWPYILFFIRNLIFIYFDYTFCLACKSLKFCHLTATDLQHTSENTRSCGYGTAIMW